MATLRRRVGLAGLELMPTATIGAPHHQRAKLAGMRQMGCLRGLSQWSFELLVEHIGRQLCDVIEVTRYTNNAALPVIILTNVKRRALIPPDAMMTDIRSLLRRQDPSDCLRNAVSVVQYPQSGVSAAKWETECVVAISCRSWTCRSSCRICSQRERSIGSSCEVSRLGSQMRKARFATLPGMP